MKYTILVRATLNLFNFEETLLIHSLIFFPSFSFHIRINNCSSIFNQTKFWTNRNQTKSERKIDFDTRWLFGAKLQA